MVKNLLTKRQDVVHRIFEILPGLSIWIILTSPIWMSFRLSTLFGNLLIVFAVYWLYRSIIFLVGLAIGYKEYKNEIEIDWLSECLKLDYTELPTPSTLPQTSNLPKHLVVVPIGGAKYDILKPTLEAIRSQNYPIELLYISLSFEERLIAKDPEYFKEMKENIRKDFAEFGDRLMIFDHPADLPGEAIGASANRTWGNKKAIETLESKGENIQDFITTSPDEDIRFHKEYFGAISYRYLINPKRVKRFYQTAVYLFSNNYWKVPAFIRAWSMSLSLPVLSSSVTHLADRETWSCYSVNLKLMKDVNYWDTSIGIDDTLFFWRPFDYLDGDFECETFFVPLYADAVYHPNKFENYRAQYKQLVRWGWGVIVFPTAMKILINNKKINFWTKLRKLYVMFEIVVLFKISALLFTFGLTIVGLLNESFNYSIYAYSLPQTLSTIMTILTYMIIPFSIYKLLIIRSFTQELSLFKQIIYVILEIPLQILILFTFAFLPFLEGPTRMMLGHQYQFLVTEKKT